MMKTSLVTPTFAIQRSADRHYSDHGWLKTHFSFSFADYFDPANQNWGALRVLNDDRIAGGTGFPTHPHRDMEILTYVFSGQLEHEDSLGNRGVVGPGGVQFMSAGTGVRHSEVNHSATDELHLVQMWVLPGRLGTKPSYGQKDFEPEERLDRWLIVASGEAGVEAPIALTQNGTMRVARLQRAALQHAFAAGRYGFLFVGDGDVQANGESLRTGDAVRMHGVEALELSGDGEVVLWDIPGVEEGNA